VKRALKAKECTKKKKKDVIATRKSCKPSGTGLSHYVLIDEKKK
jgi:modified peptide precursor CbpA